MSVVIYFISIGEKSADGLDMFYAEDIETATFENRVHVTKELCQARPCSHIVLAEMVAQDVAMKTGLSNQIHIHEWNPKMFDKTNIIKTV